MYCNNSSHTSYEACKVIVTAYYKVKNGYVCPTCGLCVCVTFDQFLSVHRTHMLAFVSVKKVDVAKRIFNGISIFQLQPVAIDIEPLPVVEVSTEVDDVYFNDETFTMVEELLQSIQNSPVRKVLKVATKKAPVISTVVELSSESESNEEEQRAVEYFSSKSVPTIKTEKTEEPVTKQIKVTLSTDIDEPTKFAEENQRTTYIDGSSLVNDCAALARFRKKLLTANRKYQSKSGLSIYRSPPL